MFVTQIPGSVLQVNNIIVILENVINYDYTIMIIKQAMLYQCLSDLLVSWIHNHKLFKKRKKKNLSEKNCLFNEICGVYSYVT